MTAGEAHVIHQRIRSCHPLGGDRAGIDPAGVEADARDDIGAGFGRHEQRFGCAYTLKCRCGIRQHNLCGNGAEPNEYGVGFERDRIGHTIASCRQINRVVFRDGFRQHAGVVGDTVAFGAHRNEIDPSVASGQIGNIRLDRREHRVQRSRVVGRLDLRRAA